MNAMRWLQEGPGRLAVSLQSEHQLVGAAVLRIGLGSFLFLEILTNWSQRRALWGPKGLYPLWLFRRDLTSTIAPSILAVHSAILSDVLLAGTAAVGLLYLIGWHTRLLTFLFVIGTWSLFNRNPLALSGGEHLIRVTLPFLLLIDSGRTLSLDAIQNRVTPGAWKALFHNVGMAFIVIQLCVVYEAAGIQKLGGELWLDGSAVGRILEVEQFNRFGLGGLVYHHHLAALALTYATLAFELSFPVLVLTRKLRPLALFGAALFHVFIAVVMGLLGFAAIMLTYQAAAVGDAAYVQVFGRMRRLPMRLRGDRPAVGELALPKRIVTDD